MRVSFGPVSPAQSERHYGCFMPACRIPLKRLMPGSLSQPRTCYPPAACSDLVNEFISSVATAGSAPPQSDSQPVSLCRVGVESVSELSAVARAKQVYSMLTAALLHARKVSVNFFRKYSKQILKWGIYEPRNHLNQKRRKLVCT